MSFSKNYVLDSLKLCLVTEATDAFFHAHQTIVTNAVKGGVTSVQLRYKGNKAELFVRLAEMMGSILKPLHTPLIVNDNVLLAKAIDAQGVHLGASDMHPQDARAMLGTSKVIGLTVDTFDALEAANQLDCIDYIGIGSIFNTTTKVCHTVWGIHQLKKVLSLSRHPVVAIGGIHQENIAAVYATGVLGIALVSAIYNADDPQKTASFLIKEMKNVRGH